MNRRIGWALLTVAAVGALTVQPMAPAGAQAPLGFEVDITEGGPGDIVTGQVDVDDVAANCTLSADELGAGFAASTDVLLNDVDDTFFPGGFNPAALSVENFDQVSWAVLQTLTANISPEQVEQEVLPQTFVMTFADIATQDPVGERANFDPAVGEAQVTVPDVEPGQWAIAAVCVRPSTDVAALADAVRANAPLIDDFVTSGQFEALTGEPFPDFPITNPAQLAFAVAIPIATALGTDLVPPMMEPQALGAQIFCVQDANGVCPGPGPGQPGEPPTAPPATPVPGQPGFTG